MSTCAAFGRIGAFAEELTCKAGGGASEIAGQQAVGAGTRTRISSSLPSQPGSDEQLQQRCSSFTNHCAAAPYMLQARAPCHRSITRFYRTVSATARRARCGSHQSAGHSTTRPAPLLLRISAWSFLFLLCLCDLSSVCASFKPIAALAESPLLLFLIDTSSWLWLP
jgi:hypothetical protein